MKAKALVKYKDSSGVKFEEFELGDLSENEVLVEVCYSSLNYKDALAVTGRASILRSLPLIPGIDAGGVVKLSNSEKFCVGDSVLVTGQGLGEIQNGGFGEFLKVNENLLTKLPEKISLKEAMIIGTAGFTAALGFFLLEKNGLNPKKGPFLVTGASGGVGSFAVHIFANNSYEVVGVSSKTYNYKYIESLGATKCIEPKKFLEDYKDLSKGTYCGCLDNVGGAVLADIISKIVPWGAVAAVGLALDSKFTSSVMPFILRGVSLLGVSSSNCPVSIRDKIWCDITNYIDKSIIDKICQEEIYLDQVNEFSINLLENKIFGRILVNCRK